MWLIACAVNDDVSSQAGELRGDANASVRDDDGDSWAAGVDCDDDDAMIHPLAAEYCNAVDDNCDGVIDEYGVDAPVQYVDADLDGYGTTTAWGVCARTPGYTDSAGDCDDADADVHPRRADFPGDGIDDDCDGRDDTEDEVCAETVPYNRGFDLRKANADRVGDDLCDGGWRRLIVDVVVERSDVVDLQALRCVCAAGSVRIARNPELDALAGLDRLATARELEVAENPLLSSLAGLEGLRQVESLQIAGQPTASLGPLAGLARVHDLGLADLAGLEDLEGLGGLREVGTLRLAELGLRSLEGLDGAVVGVLEMEGLAGLEDLEALGAISELDALALRGEVAFELLSIPAEPPIGAILLANIPGLRRVDLAGSLGTVGLDELPALEEARLPALAAGATLEVVRAPALVLLEVGATRLDHLQIEGSGLADLSGFAALEEVERVELAENAGLLSLAGLGAVERAGSVLILRNPALTTIEALRPARLRGLELQDNDALVAVGDLGGLARVDGDLRVAGNDALPSLAGWEGLWRLRGSLDLSGNAQLREVVALHGLEIVEGDLRVTENPVLAASAVAAFVEAVTTVDGEVEVFGNGGEGE